MPQNDKLSAVNKFAFDYVYDKFAPQQLIYDSCIKVCHCCWRHA